MEDRVRRPPTYLPLTPKIFDRAYLEQIWIFEQEHYSNLHLKDRADQQQATRR